MAHAGDIVDSAAFAKGTPQAVSTECETYGEELLTAATATATAAERFPSLGGIAADALNSH